MGAIERCGSGLICWLFENDKRGLLLSIPLKGNLKAGVVQIAVQSIALQYIHIRYLVEEFPNSQ
jgi:hypothetical protein